MIHNDSILDTQYISMSWVGFKVVDVGCWVKQVVGWVWSGQDNWTHGHLCDMGLTKKGWWGTPA